MILSKNVNNKKCALKSVFFNEKKPEKDSNDFWCRKLTLNVEFCTFLQLAINPKLKIQWFPLVCWFLWKNLSDFVSPVWKLHSLYCHSAKWNYCKFFISVLFNPKLTNAWCPWEMQWLPCLPWLSPPGLVVTRHKTGASEGDLCWWAQNFKWV